MYRLSCSLRGHEGDVRAVAASGSDLIVSGSRDTTLRTWRRSSPTEFAHGATLAVHQDYVNAVATTGPSADFPAGLILSSGKDKVIYATDASGASSEPSYSLIGHTENVCTLAVTPGGHIVSGSWDKTARLWINWQCAYTMEGHSQAVWAVLGLTDEDILSASADKTIRRWRNGKTVHVFNGHTDAVRGLAGISSSTFVSCSNDGTLRIWTLDGACLQELYGHTSFVYGVISIGNGELASCGEDRCVRVWKDGENMQTISHPCTSVWSVATLANGDIVSGGSDGAIRVFTRSTERSADDATLKEYEEAVASHAIPSKQLGDIDKTKLKTSEALKEPGTKEGEVKMIRNEDQVEVYQWSASESRWQKIGEVVDAIGHDRKQIYEGREYDYVFDIQLSETGPGLKLPFNASDNPWQAAQEFIWKHELSQSFLDQIANFISSNVEGVQLTSAAAPARSDPFTGGGRYVPGSAPAGSGASASPAPAHPFLSPNAYSSSGTDKTYTTAAQPKLIPKTDYTFLRTANPQAVLSKILQLNADIEKDMDTTTVALSPTQSSEVETVTGLLKNVSSSTSRIAFSEGQVDAVLKVALQWPEHVRFPGLDILRLMVLVSPEPYRGAHAEVPSILLRSVTPSSPETPLSKDQEINLMLVLRFFANAFALKEGLDMISQMSSSLLEILRFGYQNTANKNLRLATVTLLLNLIIWGGAGKTALVKMTIEFLKGETDAENCFRGMVALGTLVASDPSAKTLALSLGAKSYLASTRKVTGADETKLRMVEAELQNMLK